METYSLNHRGLLYIIGNVVYYIALWLPWICCGAYINTVYINCGADCAVYAVEHIKLSCWFNSIVDCGVMPWIIYKYKHISILADCALYVVEHIKLSRSLIQQCC